MPLPGIDRDEG